MPDLPQPDRARKLAAHIAQAVRQSAGVENRECNGCCCRLRCARFCGHHQSRSLLAARVALIASGECIARAEFLQHPPSNKAPCESIGCLSNWTLRLVSPLVVT